MKPNTIDSTEVFRDAFNGIDFPFLSLSPIESKNILSKYNNGDKSFVAMEIPTKTSGRRKAVMQAFRGVIHNIDLKERAGELKSVTSLIDIEAATAGLNQREVLATASFFRFYTTEQGFTWVEDGPCPKLYKTLLEHLRNIFINAHSIIAAQSDPLKASSLRPGSSILIGSTGKDLAILDQSSRVMPTKLYYAFSSLGAWAAGAQNFQFFGYSSIEAQLADPATNTRHAKEIGYDDSDANALTSSGLLVVPFSAALQIFKSQGSQKVFGGLPVDEWNIANLPKKRVMKDKSKALDIIPGFLIDKYYRTPFFARKLQGQALLGEKEPLRDHYQSFYNRIAAVGRVRCKHYSAPILEVRSLDEIFNIVQDIPLHSEEGIFFRGQSSMYKIHRENSVRRLLFGNSRLPEPSLITSASRTNFDYDALHFALRFHIENDLFGRSENISDSLYQNWKQKLISPSCEIDYAMMALAQHYGIPSHGLDVTSDIDVATWFATNKWSSMPDAVCQKMQPHEWSSDKHAWPVVFACQVVTHSLHKSLQKCSELIDFGLEALRPQRQKASFFLGGHSDHQNRLAETIVCAFRLVPGEWNTASNFDYLFPKPEDDKAYATMLKFAEVPEFASLGATHVARYHKCYGAAA